MTENEDKRLCSVCKIPHFERNNYYYGKLMTVRDHFAEQCYFNEKRWLINRMILGWGVVCGLDVKRIPVNPDDPMKGYRDDKVKVTKGLAIDCCGREILICEDQYVDLIPEESECCRERAEKEKIKNLIICLEYHECKSEPINIVHASCDQKEKCEFNRIRDSFKIRVKYEDDVDLVEPYGNICPLENKIAYFISWEEIQDDNILKKFLINNFNVKWVENAEINRGEDKKTIELAYENYSLSLMLDNENTRVNLTISDGRTYEFIVMKEKDKHNIYRRETVHGYICKKLKEGCTKCPECPCLILAKITQSVSTDPSIIYFDPCYKRKLVYSNSLLYDLINCYHGDLPHIISINWQHGEELEWSQFIEMIRRNEEDLTDEGPGLQVGFDREVNGVDVRTFLFMVKYREDREGGFYQDRYIPGNVHYDANNKKWVFKVDIDWFIDLRISDIQEGAGFKILIRGDHILDKRTNRALDANFIGGKLPSGNGTQGGEFVSWFYVRANPDYKSRTSGHTKM